MKFLVKSVPVLPMMDRSRRKDAVLFPWDEVEVASLKTGLTQSFFVPKVYWEIERGITGDPAKVRQRVHASFTAWKSKKPERRVFELRQKVRDDEEPGMEVYVTISAVEEPEAHPSDYPKGTSGGSYGGGAIATPRTSLQSLPMR